MERKRGTGEAVVCMLLYIQFCMCSKKKVACGRWECLWDSLPLDVVMTFGPDAFKRGLEIFLEEKSIIVSML